MRKPASRLKSSREPLSTDVPTIRRKTPVTHFVRLMSGPSGGVFMGELISPHLLGDAFVEGSAWQQ